MNNFDEDMMNLALDEALKGEFSVRPNPAVGCVIVKDGRVIGKGYHPKAGEPHAEIFALRDVQNNAESAQDSTAYVTLEPCSHFGRTPPCSNALINAGVKRVVIATLDPNPKVAGSGLAMLNDAGIETIVGVGADRAQMINAGFLKAMATGLPFVRVKIAASLDGRTAMQNGQSKWITGELARTDVQKLRAKSGAIITGSGTVLADNPALTVRLPSLDLINIPPPKIVVVDRGQRLRITDDYQIFKDKNTLIWRDGLHDLLKTLVADYQIYDVLVEAGSTLVTSFLLERLTDELIVYQAPRFLGVTGRAMFGATFENLSESLNFRLASSEQMGDDLKMVFHPVM